MRAADLTGDGRELSAPLPERPHTLAPCHPRCLTDDLKILEVVDAGMSHVAFTLPLSVFGDNGGAS